MSGEGNMRTPITAEWANFYEDDSGKRVRVVLREDGTVAISTCVDAEVWIDAEDLDDVIAYLRTAHAMIQAGAHRPPAGER